MKTLHNEDFIEFTVLPFFCIFFAALFLYQQLLTNAVY